MKTTDTLTCALCGTESKTPINDEDLLFCCHGCRCVYRILETRGNLARYRTDPLFHQAVKSGLITNPGLLETLRRQSETKEAPQRLHLEIADLWCPSCAEVIRLILMQEKGIGECVVDYTTDLASIEYFPKEVGKEEILKKIASLGYHPRLLTDAAAAKGHSRLVLRLLIAAFCSLNIMMFSWPVYATFFEADSSGLSPWLPWFAWAFSLPVITFCAWPIFKRFRQGLRAGFLGMEALIAMSVGAAFSLSVWNLMIGDPHIYFDSMSVVVTFLLLGKLLEQKAKFSAKESWLQLTRSLPRRGRKRELDGTTSYIRLKDAQIGDILVTHAGEKVVLDGIVAEGRGAVDESHLTGEAVPIEKGPEDPVTAGAILQSGFLAYRVTATLEGSTLQQMVSMIEHELHRKTRAVHITDTIVQWFVPIVASLSAGTFLLTKDFSRALSVLLIACPCPIGIAVPLVESRFMQRAAALGALIRNRGCLSWLGKETRFVFDKTGTVTEGKFTVRSGIEALSEEEASVVKAMCRLSSHPVSVAIDGAMTAAAASIGSFSSFQGKGIQAVFNEDLYQLGSPAWIGVYAEGGEDESTVVFVAKNRRPIAKIHLGDRIRPKLPELIDDLPPSYLVSGDHPRTVEFVARACRFADFRAGAHPLEKGEFVRQARERGEVVCFVGDGLNDAPAIAGANIGISVKSAADMSIQSSDILLTTDNLRVIQKVRQRAAFARSLSRQNLAWAFGYNSVGVGLAMAGLLTPIFAASAMVVSSLFVILNSQRC